MFSSVCELDTPNVHQHLQYGLEGISAVWMPVTFAVYTLRACLYTSVFIPRKWRSLCDTSEHTIQDLEYAMHRYTKLADWVYIGKAVHFTFLFTFFIIYTQDHAIGI